MDRLSINPGFQAFEKFVSGMYLGEIARQVLASLVDAVPPILFGGKGTPVLNAHYGLDTSFMSNIETAWDDNDDHTLPSLSAFDPEQLHPQVRVKLDRIRQVIVEDLAFQSEQVTLKDATVSVASLVCAFGPTGLCRLFVRSAISWLDVPQHSAE